MPRGPDRHTLPGYASLRRRDIDTCCIYGQMGALAGTGTAGVPTPGGVGKHLSYCDTSHLKKSDKQEIGRSEASAIATARRSGGRLYIMIGDHGVSIATLTAMVWRRRAREISWCMGVWQPTIHVVT